MKTTRRQFLQNSVIASLASVNTVSMIEGEGPVTTFPENEAIDPFAIASQHVISREVAGPTFFEGMLLGNGDVGVCAVVRPDALGIHISKSDCWHTFRHAFGTLLKANGEDVKTVQELLRRANSRIGLEVYTQAVTSHKRAAQSKVVRMMVPDLGGKKDESHP